MLDTFRSSRVFSRYFLDFAYRAHFILCAGEKNYKVFNKYKQVIINLSLLLKLIFVDKRKPLHCIFVQVWKKESSILYYIKSINISIFSLRNVILGVALKVECVALEYLKS